MSWSQSFNAVINQHSRVLILGSMPGVRSLKDAEYYAHPRNAFWPLMQSLFCIEASAPYAERLAALNAAGVGLWDVYHQCYRPGSLDTAIDKSTAEINDFVSLFEHFPLIEIVAFNGKAAQQAFERHIVKKGLLPDSIRVIGLPSTSPANASFSFDQKLSAWSVITECLPALSARPSHAG